MSDWIPTAERLPDTYMRTRLVLVQRNGVINCIHSYNVGLQHDYWQELPEPYVPPKPKPCMWLDDCDHVWFGPVESESNFHWQRYEGVNHKGEPIWIMRSSDKPKGLRALTSYNYLLDRPQDDEPPKPKRDSFTTLRGLRYQKSFPGDPDPDVVLSVLEEWRRGISGLQRSLDMFNRIEASRSK